MPLQINDSLRNFSPKPLDFRYCKFVRGIATPYNGAAEALSSLIPPYRYQGLTILISDQGSAKEYWFYGGTADSDLVVKGEALAAVAYSGSYNDLVDLPPLPPAQMNADWNAVTGVSEILNKPAQVSAFSNDAGYLTQITATNGISTVGNQVVLGQDIGDPNSPGNLLSAREIVFNGQTFQFSDPQGMTVFTPADIFLSSGPNTFNSFFVDINANWGGNITIGDFTNNSPSLTLDGGLNGSVANNGNYTRMEVVGSSDEANFVQAGMYLYAGSAKDSFTSRTYIATGEPEAWIPGVAESFADKYYQALVIFNENYDTKAYSYPDQGTLAVVATTWDTQYSPTLILGNVHSFNRAGAAAKLIDLQTNGTSRFSVNAGSGNTVVGSADNGSFFQVQQPEVGDFSLPNAVNITSTWNTIGTPVLIKAEATNSASTGSPSFLQFDVDGTEVYNSNIYAWTFAPVDGEDTIAFFDGTLSIQSKDSNYSAFLSAREGAQLVLSDLAGGMPYIQLSAGPSGRYSGFLQLEGSNGELQISAGNQQTGLLSMRPSNSGWPTTNFIVTTGGPNVVDGGQSFQVNQYPVQVDQATGAVAVTSTWETTAEPTLIKASVTDNGSGDNAKVMDLQVNTASVFTVDKQGEITTGDPGSGIAKWKLGKVIDQEGLVLNSQQYIEVTIDGVNYRLALIATTSG